MTLNIPIPDSVDKAAVDELRQAAREFVAVSLYRKGQLSPGKLAEFLGLGRGEIEGILARHGVVDVTPEELAKECESIRRAGA